MLQCRAHQCCAAVTPTIVETVAIDVVDHHAGTADQGDCGAARKTAFSRGDSRDAKTDDCLSRLMQKILAILRLNPARQWEPCDVQCG